MRPDGAPATPRPEGRCH